jgi:PKHD-type hydroxylase
MPIVLSDILSAAEARVLFEAAAALPFEDGARTAGRTARAVKENLQAAPGAASEAVLTKLRNALAAHPAFQALALPKSFGRMMISRTEGGGHYGDHVDNALMGESRADLSFTLFLAPPETYQGGELTISDRVEDRRFKLGQGEVIVYPSDTLHRVEPVTNGSRLVAVGWVQSWIRDPRQREILFDLWQAIAAAEATGDASLVQLLSKSRSNLIRMWAV